MNSVLFAKMDQVFSKENKTLKKYWKFGKKILEKSGKSQGILSVRKSGNPVYHNMFFPKNITLRERLPKTARLPAHFLVT